MRKALVFITLVLVLVLLCASGAHAQHTYYVSFSTGADTNTSTQAQSKSTPWKNLKGMRSATSNASSYTPVPGDTFIMMGCDDWPNASFPVTWSTAGTSGAHITIGVDMTWYNTGTCPTGWNRPVWDAQGASMGGATECTGTNNNMFLIVNGVNYVDFNWIEMPNYFMTANCAGGISPGDRWINVNSPGDFDTLNDIYIHAAHAGSFDSDRQIGVSGNNCAHCFVNQSVINNSDGTQYTQGGIQFGMTRTVCQYVANCAKPTIGGEIAYNDIEHIGVAISGTHPNCIETVTSVTATFYIHDNRVANMPNSPLEQCETLQIGNTGETDYVWNNLFYDLGGGDIIHFPQGGSSKTGLIGMFFVNNTVVPGPSNVCGDWGTGASWTSFFIFENNHCMTPITPGGNASSQLSFTGGTITGATTISIGNNFTELLATANGQGYVNTSTYVYSPSSGSSPTVGAGANLTSIWPAGFATSDTTYACSQQTVSGVVQSVCPGRAGNARPTSGAWDAGAYEFSAPSQAVAPSCSPGTGTYGTAQTVTCTNTNSGTTVMCYSTSTTPATNALGTGCATGTQYTTTIAISSNTTLNVIAGTSTLTDSSVVSYVYTFTTGATNTKGTSGLTFNNGIAIH